MATAEKTAKKPSGIKDFMFVWEGKDKTGKLLRGEMRAGGNALVQATLRRQATTETLGLSACRRSGRRSQRHAPTAQIADGKLIRSGIASRCPGMGLK